MRVVISRIVALILSGATLLAPASSVAVHSQAIDTPNGFREAFGTGDGALGAWHPANWDVSVHERDWDSWWDLPPMDASAGPCGGTYHVAAYASAVFACNGALTTAANPGSGAAAIYLTPNQLVDFSDGEAIVRFKLSTLAVNTMEPIDLWITPYDEAYQLPSMFGNDLNGMPRTFVHIAMQLRPASPAATPGSGFQTMFSADVLRLVPDLDSFSKGLLVPGGGEGFHAGTPYETVLTPSDRQLETFELRLSRTHLKFGMPERDLTWLDTVMPDIGWSTGVVQLGYHAAACPGGDNACAHNAWHWSDVEIAPAREFTMLHADEAYVDAQTSSEVTFPAPAPADAHLRFVGVGDKIEVSFDGGSTWRRAEPKQGQNADSGTFLSYWTPVPVGTTHAQVRGQGWSSSASRGVKPYPEERGPWMVRDISVWSLESPDAAIPAGQVDDRQPTWNPLDVQGLWPDLLGLKGDCKVGWQTDVQLFMCKYVPSFERVIWGNWVPNDGMTGWRLVSTQVEGSDPEPVYTTFGRRTFGLPDIGDVPPRDPLVEVPAPNIRDVTGDVRADANDPGKVDAGVCVGGYFWGARNVSYTVRFTKGDETVAALPLSIDNVGPHTCEWNVVEIPDGAQRASVDLQITFNWDRQDPPADVRP